MITPNEEQVFPKGNKNDFMPKTFDIQDKWGENFLIPVIFKLFHFKILKKISK